MYFDLCLETQEVHPNIREQMLVTAYKGMRDEANFLDGFTAIAWNLNFTGSLAKDKVGIS